MKRHLIRFAGRHWFVLPMCFLVFVMLPLVGVPLMIKSENRNTLADAQAGDLLRQIEAGDLYAKGSYGIEPDAQEAARWYRIAAERGHSAAQMRLALAYLSGAGVPRDEQMGFQWYKVAANQGWQDAMIMLSRLYEDGTGVEANLVEAYRWAWLAYAAVSLELQEQVRHESIARSKSGGNAALARVTDMVFQRMPEDQKEEAMRRARAWEPVRDR